MNFLNEFNHLLNLLQYFLHFMFLALGHVRS